jgi:pimeloyl-ACP methyl ester carboxylesterase
MPFVCTNGIRLAYQRMGHGEDVLLIMGSGGSGRIWTRCQTPALNKAGYATVTFNNRGVEPSDCPDGVPTLADLAADTSGLMEALGLAPCHIVGTSLGATIAQELAIHHPQLVRSAVLMATRARWDAFRKARDVADFELRESGITLPPAYEATRRARDLLSPATLSDDDSISRWLELFEAAADGGSRQGGQGYLDAVEDRRPALGRVAAPCRVIAFEDDVITPPHLAREVADAIPDCDFVRIPDCGHLGYLERPAEVNLAIIEFLKKH